MEPELSLSIVFIVGIIFFFVAYYLCLTLLSSFIIGVLFGFLALLILTQDTDLDSDLISLIYVIIFFLAPIILGIYIVLTAFRERRNLIFEDKFLL